MFGRSVYLSDALEAVASPDQLQADVIFTSLHVEEEISGDYGERVRVLLEALKTTGAKVMADISPRGIQALGCQSLADFARETGVDVVRCDFGFGFDDMLEASHYAVLAVNASTLDFRLASELRSAGAEVWAVHNFYPRPETGLDEDLFDRRTAELRGLGIVVAAFVSGDKRRRGPIFAGLPTLEAHRDLPPYVQYVQLVRKHRIDLVLVGDPAISREQARLIQASEEDGVIRLPVDLSPAYQGLIGRVWTIRDDSPWRVARLAESRAYATSGARIAPDNCGPRPVGAITIDNERYLRYSGEIQVVREALPACERVNVIGSVRTGFEGILEVLEGGTKVELVGLGA